MAGRGRVPPAHVLHPGASGLLPDPIIPLAGSGAIGQAAPPSIATPQQQLPPSMVLIEHKMATQHAEIQKLLTENQRLAAAHLALRQELANARQEVQHLQQQMSRMQMEEEDRMLSLIEKAAKLEEELRAAEPLKAELQRVHNDAQQLSAERQELMVRFQQISEQLQKSRADSQQAVALQSENEKLRQELERSRVSCEREKKAKSEQEEQKKAMEKTLVLLAKEVEKLHTDLTSEKRAYSIGSHGETYSVQYGMETPYLQSHNSYRDSYGVHQEGASALAEHRRSAEESARSSNTAPSHPMPSSVSPSPVENMSQIWKAHVAPNGRTFYHNTVTGETQWEVPAELVAGSGVQHTVPSQVHHIHQAPQGEIVQREQAELRQVQSQQTADHGYLSNNLPQTPQTQGQYLAHAQFLQNSSVSPVQLTQAQIPTQPAGQGHAHQLATQMTQLIQGQFPYNAQASQYQMGSQSPYLQAQPEYPTPPMTKLQPVQNAFDIKAHQAHSVSPFGGVGQYN